MSGASEVSLTRSIEPGSKDHDQLVIPLSRLSRFPKPLSDRRDGPADLVEQLACPVPVAPGVDVIPVDPVPLDGDHVAGVVAILGAPTLVGPAELGDDDVLGGREPGFAAQESDTLAALES